MTDEDTPDIAADRPLRERLIALAALATFIVLLWAMAAGYAWIARRPLAASTVVGGLAGLFSIGMFSALSRKRVKLEAVPDPLGARIVSVLESHRPRKFILQRGSGGAHGTFPRPMVNGPRIMIPDRVLRDWSDEAILWSIQTGVAVDRAFTRRAVPLLIGSMLLLLVLMALLDRWRLASGIYLLIPFGGIVIVLTAAGLYNYHLERIEDARATITPEDRAAAKEALLYPYRAQREKSPMSKWMFFSAELRGRARHLGIDLDAEIQGR